MSSIDRSYYFHSFFFRYAEGTFFIFGALYLYNQCGSVPLALTGFFIESFVALSLRTCGLKIFETVLKTIGSQKTAILGLSLEALFLFILLVGGVHWWSVIAAFTIKAFGSVFYINVFHAALFSDLGNTDNKAGLNAAHFHSVTIFSGLCSAIITTALALAGFFYAAIAIACLCYVGAALTLGNIPFADTSKTQFRVREITKTATLWNLLANMNPQAMFEKRGLPIVMATTIGQQASIGILGLVPILEIIFSYIMGLSKDYKKRPVLIGISLTAICSWFGYLFIATPLQFAVNNSVVNISHRAMAIARDAKTAQEVSNHDAMMGTIAFEIARAFGGIIGIPLLLGIYFYFGEIPVWTLALAFVFVIPKAIFVCKK